jgi:hypothetical protein
MSDILPLPSPTPWWRRPIGIGLLGLVLMVGGWKLSTWEGPLTPRQQQNAERLSELRRMADGELRGKLDGYAEHARGLAPYEVPGRLVIFLGLVLFVVAGVRMYRTPAHREAVEEEKETAAGG